MQVHVQPCAQVAQVQFREIYLPATGAEMAGAGGDAEAEADAEVATSAEPGIDATASSRRSRSSSSIMAIERRCVMEVSVSNRGRWPLQVRVCE